MNNTILSAILAISILTGSSFMDFMSKLYPDIIFRVKTDRKMIALTIDDGPTTYLTPKILDVLDKYDVKATFFVPASRIKGKEAIVDSILAGGHEIGNHGKRHWPTFIFRRRGFIKQVLAAQKKIPDSEGEKMYRPPHGIISRKQLRYLSDLGYTSVLGDLYYFDPMVHNPGKISKSILRDMKPGSIIILHDGRKSRMQTLDILETILPEIKRRGYEVVTVSELLANESE